MSFNFICLMLYCARSPMLQVYIYLGHCFHCRSQTSQNFCKSTWASLTTGCYLCHARCACTTTPTQCIVPLCCKYLVRFSRNGGFGDSTSIWHFSGKPVWWVGQVANIQLYWTFQDARSICINCGRAACGNVSRKIPSERTPPSQIQTSREPIPADSVGEH